MSDNVFTSQQVPGGNFPVDNEQVTTTSGTVNRQRVRIGGSTGTRLAEVSTSGGIYTAELEETALTGTITADSTTGVAPSTGLSDTTSPPAANSTVVVVSSASHSSWSVQTTGTWTGKIYTEVTIDGVTWIPVNSRQSAGGRLANNFTANGLYRGVYGGMQKFRVRAVGAFTGTANIFIVLGVDAAVFQNSDIVAQTEFQYYSASTGLNSGWGVHSQDITLTTSGTEYTLLFLWNNDSTGGRVLYLAKVTKGASNTCRIRRYRTGPGGTNMTRTSGGTALTINNRANQAAAATAAQAWGGNNIIVANQPSYYEKSAYISSGGGGIETDEGGGILIPPQTGILWTALAGAANMVAGIEVAYWDGSSLT